MKFRTGLPFASHATPNGIIISGVCIRKHGADKTAWIELHQGLRTHPKVKRLADVLKVERAHATGLLCNLWLWAVDHARDGQLKKYTDEEIAEGAWWGGAPDVLRKALKASGWEDSNGTLHDWEEYGVRLIEAARKRKEKWKQQQENVPERSKHT